jgi:hypothetical protein
VTCTALDQCHDPGVCDTGTGTCSNPNKANGSACSDGSACTVGDSCLAGACVGGPPPNCDDLNVCTLDACDALAGCTHVVQDADADGVCDALDCAPNDPAVWTSPVEIQGLRVDKGAATHLSWTAQSQAPRYDVVGGALAELRSAQGSGGAACLGDDAPLSAWDDSVRPDPAVGQGYYYLVRGQNVCGTGTYGFASSGIERVPSAGCP